MERPGVAAPAGAARLRPTDREVAGSGGEGEAAPLRAGVKFCSATPGPTSQALGAKTEAAGDRVARGGTAVAAFAGETDNWAWPIADLGDHASGVVAGRDTCCCLLGEVAITTAEPEDGVAVPKESSAPTGGTTMKRGGEAGWTAAMT
mmetsp:Transcript_51110/g.141562  ORF Transcript_51110/g.141562 Transcript_51110/m.141562 type:complete len:148 (-) Transcript_51110:1611-2054(-)